MRKVFLRIGSFLAMLAVILGAFGAHALKDVVPAEQLTTFETGVRYQMYHALAILLVDLLIHFRKTKYLIAAGWLFTAGIICFSGSLYILTFRYTAWQLPVGLLGPITPLGGLLFVSGWVVLFISGFVRSSRIPHSMSRDNEF
ncbi:MAG: DUF423 domain-containing protein [Saprospiraceae bacterium]